MFGPQATSMWKELSLSTSVRKLLLAVKSIPLQLVCCCLQATKLVRLMKSVALTLNQHYPSRLQQLFFVEPPAVMKWPIQAAKPLLHSDTGNKIQVCVLSDPALPVDLNRIPESW